MFEGGFDASGVEAEGAGAGFEGYAAVSIDDVEAVGPAGVIVFGGVLEIVDERGEFNSELHDAERAHLFALFEIFRSGEDHVVVEVIGILPDVGGVRFANVDGVKLHFIFVLFVERVEGGNLPPEGRSSVAAEDENDRLLATEGRKLHGAGVIGGFEGEVWRHFADAGGAIARDFP